MSMAQFREAVDKFFADGGRDSRKIEELINVAAALLDNQTCSCGGWKCARCKLAVKEMKDLLKGYRR
jgi:hypothetical protein